MQVPLRVSRIRLRHLSGIERYIPDRVRPDYYRAFNSGECYVVVDEYNDPYALLFPDMENFNSGYIEIHTVLNFRGSITKPERQVSALKEYLGIMFNKGHRKIVCQVSQKHRLIKRIVEGAGFTVEGVHRNEYEDGETLHDVNYYGMLKEEFHG